MFPIRDNMISKEKPILVYTLIGLNVLLYLWDRGLNLNAPIMAFADLTMRPAEIALTLRGEGDPAALARIFTSMFLHGSLAHLIGNMLFLLTFGPSVERALGGPRFALQYLFWGIVAAGAHVFVNPDSMTPTLGASGAIGGVLGSYFILFPGAKVSLFVWPLPIPISVLSWVLLLGWFAFQILLPQQGVANWAHAGGFMAGMATVLILGGRTKVLANSDIKEDDDFED